MTPFIGSMLTVALGFAVSALATSGFEAATSKRASVRMLRSGDLAAVAAAPLVTLGAPFMLVRAVLSGVPTRRSAPEVAAVTVASGLWSLVIGAAVLSAFAL